MSYGELDARAGIIADIMAEPMHSLAIKNDSSAIL
jgi:hypothetical protein